jgi:hypothetical protein
MESIRLTHWQWLRLRKKLISDYKPSTVLIGSNMRKVLGFTARSAEPKDEFDFEPAVILDFFSGPLQTMFLLKYSEYLETTKEDLEKSKLARSSSILTLLRQRKLNE